MPINNMVMSMNPLAPIEMGNFGNLAMQREQLRLQREQFEETLRRNQEDEKLRRMAEAGEQARARMMAEREKASAAAAAAAEEEEKRTALEGKVLELGQKGDIEGGQIMGGGLPGLGGRLDIIQRPGQLPLWRLHHDAAADDRQEAAEASANWEHATPEERPIFRNPLDESEEQPVNAIRAPTPTGQAIDLQALADARVQRLRPGLSRFTAAYPDTQAGWQSSAGETQAGVEELARAGMPAPGLIDEYRQQRQGPDAAYKALMENDAAAAQRNEPTEMQRLTFEKEGRAASHQSFTTNKVQQSIATVELASKIRWLLTNDNPDDDAQAAQLLMDLSGVKGTPSDTDLNMTIGMEKSAAWDRGRDWLLGQINGGFQGTQKNAFLGWVDKQVDSESKKLDNWLDRNEKDAGAARTEDEARGIRRYAERNIPSWALDRYAKKKAEKEKAEAPARAASARASQAEVEDEIYIQAAELGLDPEAVMSVVPGESGGDPRAKSDRSSAGGVFQFIDDTAKRYGLKNAEEYRALPAAEQVRLGLQRFKDIGLDESSTPDDFAIAQAAPDFLGDPPETIVYRKGSREWEKNAPWRPADGGDITVGSIQDYYRRTRGGSSGGGELGVTAVGDNAPTPKSDADRRALEMVKAL